MTMINKIRTGLLASLFSIGLTSAIANTASYTNTSVCDGGITSFTSTSVATTGSIILHEWDFDGDSIFDATGLSTTHKYAGAGTFNVILKITTDSGFVAYTSNPVSVYPKPNLAYTYIGNCLGDPTKFSGSSNISNGNITNYDWEFDGNADFADGSGANPSFTFIAPGYFNVGLKVTSDRGCTSELYQTVTVAPKPSINFSSDNVCAGKSVEFFNSSVSLGSTINYNWKLGDGTTSSVFEPSHLYGSSGQYEVTLVGTNLAGCSDSLTRSVVVFANPIASFNVVDACDGEEVEITNNSDYSGASAQSNYWTFGDGKSTLDLNSTVKHLYTSEGSYNVTLSVSTSDNCYDTTSGSLMIHSIPVYSIEIDGPTDFCEGGEVMLSVSPDSAVFNAWSTGVNSNSIKVETSGLYEVVLFTSFGCSYETSVEVLVAQPTDFTVSNDTTIENGEEVSLWAKGAVSYEWGPNVSSGMTNLSMVKVSPESSTVYEVIATNEYGCINDAKIEITVINDYNLVPSNLMTPDGNGQNDTWFVRNIDRYPDCEVLIYNQNGVLIYSKVGYNNEFDGTISGSELPEGQYFYIITCDGRDNKFSGNFNLLRINE